MIADSKLFRLELILWNLEQILANHFNPKSAIFVSYLPEVDR